MWQYILMTVGGFLTAAGAALLFEVPLRQSLICGMIGILSCVVNLAAGAASFPTVISTFLATLLAALLSNFAARIEKMPVTVFLIPCIFPFVPGAGMYRIVYSLIENRQQDAIMYFFQTMEIAGAIALSVFFVDTLFRKGVKVHTKCT
jgi:uncharacterized membrane protein YjjB (DUF3815 family)